MIAHQTKHNTSDSRAQYILDRRAWSYYSMRYMHMSSQTDEQKCIFWDGKLKKQTEPQLSRGLTSGRRRRSVNIPSFLLFRTSAFLLYCKYIRTSFRSHIWHFKPFAITRSAFRDAAYLLRASWATRQITGTYGSDRCTPSAIHQETAVVNNQRLAFLKKLRQLIAKVISSAS